MNFRVAIIMLSLVFFCFIGNAKSVGDKVPGYIILDNGKKVEGSIIIGDVIENELQIKFISKGKSTRKIYTPRDLQAYGYQINDIDDVGLKTQKWVNYKRHKVKQPPKAFAPTLVFLQLVEQGSINLYSFIMETNTNQERSFNYVLFVEDENENLSEVSDASFEQTARILFKDYTAMTAQTKSDYFLYRNLDQMVRDYNYWKVNQHDKNEYRMASKSNKNEALEGVQEF